MGLPDPALIPVERFQQAWEAILSRIGAEALGVSPVQGIAPLRELLSDRLRCQGVSANPENVVVVNDSQQGLDLLLRLFTEPGDTVITEAPTYYRNGMEVERVEFLLARYRPRLIYTGPTYQNPTGCTMSLERRQKLLTLAQRYQVPIIEDDPFSELYFDEPPPPPIKALDDAGHVLYLGTFSKCLSPGLRVGWLVAPQPVAKLATLLRRATDLQPNTLGQHLVIEFARRGWLDEHVAAARASYANRCQAMDAALRRHLPRGAKWHTPGGGLFLWLELPEQVAAHELPSETGQQGVVFLPGRFLYPTNGRQNVCRLNFSVPDEESIERAVAVLGSALCKLLCREVGVVAEQTLVSPAV